jgi:hypothetical protein
MVQTGTFPFGINNDKDVLCSEYVLVERTFRHSLELANDPAIDSKLISDPVYYDAAMYSKRLKVAGIDRLTPDMVLDLAGDDADELASASVQLDKRRAEFRKSKQAASQAAAGTP